MVDKEGILWHPIGDGRIVCDACNRRCSIPEGSHGFCYVRKNMGGKLYLSVYGKLAAMQIDPIEKKPFNHFYPGTHVFTVGTISCNWHCHPAGTQITLADGSAKSVESLARGDVLWSYDVTRDEMSRSKPRPNVVTEIRTRQAELWAVWWGGKKATQKKKSRKTLITGDHPVLTKGGWKQVVNLKPGDYVLRVWPQVGTNRKAAQRTAEFECKKCGKVLGGLEAWATHRNSCYADQQVMPESQREIIREMMRTRNPMRDPAAVEKQKATVSERLRTDPDYGLHRNIERFRQSLHKHPSNAQLIMYGVLNEMGIKHEPEFMLKPDKLLPESQTRYILDVALPDLKLDFEVDGWWHYNDERIMKRDIVRDATLKLNGWKVVRIPGSSIYNHADHIKQLVSAHLKNLVMENDKRWVRVLDVKRTGQVTTVYGFECIPSHTYVADGILVHNCLFCQNHAISKETDVYGEDVTPEQVPRIAGEYDCEGVGFSYNEPTIFVEFVIDTAREAHRKGKYAVFVTNGYGTEESVRAIKGYVDAVVVDYKGSGEELFQRRQTMTVSAEPIKNTLLELKRQAIHTELTDLVIPQVGEDLGEAKKLCRWLYDNLGPDVPIQFTRFHPDYKMQDIPVTPYDLLLKHHEIAKEAGLNFPYIGNVPGSPQEHTYCPGCGAKVIERQGFRITRWGVDDDHRCKVCGYKIPITGNRATTFHYRDIESFYIPKQ
ncbi:MAG: AmmeMemoRadiSam system radical SAM enzyme, partial [Thaumarchaeota archaeon]|nr:AmmeMemoRadiSam system radical SAM enzyme [Nitrososphaerota archaeon]